MSSKIGSAKKGIVLEEFKLELKTQFPDLFSKEVFLACSGGIDSMTLCRLLEQSNIKPTLLHCNFQLRGEESERDETFVRNYAKANHLKIIVKKFDTQSEIANEKGNTQEIARKLRYDWFTSIVPENACLLTAHHLDDSIETFFINLSRGTGLKGLMGIPPNRGNIYRPLVSFSKEQIKLFAKNKDLSYVEDSSNSKSTYLRNRLRNEIIPLLKDQTEGLNKKVLGTMHTIREAEEWAIEEATNFRKKYFNKVNGGIQIDFDLTALSHYQLTHIFADLGIYRKNVKAFSLFLNGQGSGQFHLDTHILLRSRGQFSLLYIPQESQEINWQIISPQELPFRFQTPYATYSIEITQQKLPFNDKQYQQLDFDTIEFPIYIRLWQRGDKIMPLGMNKNKLISDILTDKKIDSLQKKLQLVLCDKSGRIIAAPNLLISERHKITSKTTSFLTINYR